MCRRVFSGGTSPIRKCKQQDRMAGNCKEVVTKISAHPTRCSGVGMVLQSFSKLKQDFSQKQVTLGNEVLYS
jgi:hypothetical protein